MKQPVDADEAFINAHTVLEYPALVPGILLYLATEITPLWQASEAFLHSHNVAPPFWAFAWPGSQALAVYVAQNPALVAGKRVLDFAAGSGLAAIACARAGAVVAAADIDPLARVAMRMNAAVNGVALDILAEDVVGQDCRWDVILCGDVCYEAPMAAHILPWLRRCAAQAVVIIADPGRNYAPKGDFIELARIRVPTSLDLEEGTNRDVTVMQL
ncbi:MAG: 50S ribosomal protein L11 methyltransferase [Acidocella sp.]|nr:50S ribosomal protein L11 methyltransferase [Acidocella sp.]